MSALAMIRALRKRTSPVFSPYMSLHVASIPRFISTLILAEHENGAIKPSSLSALAAAGALSEGNSISMLLAGAGPSLKEAASHAASIGPLISQVLVADTDELRHPLAEPWAELVHLVQQQGGYSHIVAASSSFGKNILPRAAALLDVSPITDVTEISGPQLFVRPIYAGNALCTVRYTGGGPCMLTIRSTSFPVPSISADSKSNAAKISQVDLSTFSQVAVGRSRYVNHSSEETERPDLGNARIVVTGGRALKSAENFKLIEKLAEKLGAAVGATRAAVDSGYVPNELQIKKTAVAAATGAEFQDHLISKSFYDIGPHASHVGQTGKIVAPDLYMAFGVSGAIQHLAGIRDSKVIVAVNKDADAPIFQVADYGLVADLFEVLPELLEKLPDKK